MKNLHIFLFFLTCLLFCFKFFSILPIYDMNLNKLNTSRSVSIHMLHTVIHDLSTFNVDKSSLKTNVLYLKKQSLYYNLTTLNDNKINGVIITKMPVRNIQNAHETQNSYPQTSFNTNKDKNINFDLNNIPVIINEIQFQPKSPEPEWIEFFNKSDKPYQLINSYIQNPAGKKMYFSVELSANDFFIITNNLDQFLQIHPDCNSQKVFQTSNWVALPNAGTTLFFYLSDDLLAESITYKANSGKHGLSLERINPFSDEINNWSYSTSEIGSTPLTRNSQTPLDINIIINSIKITQDNEHVNHKIHLKNIGLFKPVSTNLVISVKNENNNYLFLNEFNISLDVELEYMIQTSITNNFGYDFYNYKLLFDSISYEYYKSYLNNNPPVIINEIMSNPITDEPKWLELFKLRDFIPEKGLKLFSHNDSLHIPLFESDFSIITQSKSDSIFIREKYAIPNNIQIVRGLKSLNISGANLILKDYDDNIYEHFAYTNQFSPNKGISAERISPILPPDAQNWTACLSISTPAKINSVYMDIMPTTNSIKIQNNPFSPFKNENCIIIVNVQANQVRANITIFDIKGREIIKLANNIYISGSHSFIWNGYDKQNHIVNPGVYPLYAEIFDLSGEKLVNSKMLVYIGK